MWTQYILWLSLSRHILAVWATTDGPFDFDKTPGGGPSTLRACAQYAYNSNSRAGSIYSLGCQTISCVCRSDLINQAHEYITTAVVTNCGQDANVDIQQALNIYNAYCSANGYAIPGYTYTSTLTVPATSPSGPISTSSLDAVGSATGVPPPSNPTGKVTTTVLVPLSVATVTSTMVVKSWGTKVQPRGFFHLLCLVPVLPMRYIHALADSIIVMYTQPAPSTDVPVAIVTTFLSVQAGPATTIDTVYDSKNSQPTMTEGSGSSSDKSATTGGGGGGPSKIELVGIIVGIIGGIITTAATVYICVIKR